MFAMIWICLVQSPSEYLGITVGKMGTYNGRWRHESYTGGTDTARFLDSMKVTETFVYNGHEAFRILNVRHTTAGVDIDTAFTDSVWNDAPWLMARGRVSDTISRDVFYFRTPFTKGDNWSTGIEGTYRDNFDGYSGLDLMVIRSEIMTVEDSEVVSVPAGTFFTWRLKKHTKGCITEPSNPLLDSVPFERVLYMWWSPGNSVVKDTTVTVATAYVLGNPIPDKTYESRVLSFISGIRDAAVQPSPLRLVSPNPVRNSLTLSRPPTGRLDVYLYDPMGKKVLSESDSDGPEMSLDLSGIPCGVYLLRAVLDQKPTLLTRIVKVK
ncbi:MAG: T9SS type A sorting domain-containing protein [candidate division WOR-3 bacterium]